MVKIENNLGFDDPRVAQQNNNKIKQLILKILPNWMKRNNYPQMKTFIVSSLGTGNKVNVYVVGDSTHTFTVLNTNGLTLVAGNEVIVLYSDNNFSNGFIITKK